MLLYIFLVVKLIENQKRIMIILVTKFMPDPKNRQPLTILLYTDLLVYHHAILCYYMILFLFINIQKPPLQLFRYSC